MTGSERKGEGNGVAWKLLEGGMSGEKENVEVKEGEWSDAAVGMSQECAANGFYQVDVREKVEGEVVCKG